MNSLRSVFILASILLAPYSAVAQSADWNGEWMTDRGLMTLRQDGSNVNGQYGTGGSLSGQVNNNQLSLRFQLGNSTGTVTFTQQDDGQSFDGRWESRGSSGSWRGWRLDPHAESGETADFSGFWLSSWGPMQLDQQGTTVSGPYGAQGWSSLEGEVTGRKLHVDWKRLTFTGQAWLEQSADGKRLYGMSTGNNPSTWIGIRLEGYEHHVAPVAGEVVRGYTDDGMLYHLRMPDDWQADEPVDLIVLLHGSNWTTRGMVWVTNENWPEIGRRFAIVGIEGESWASWSDLDDLRFNYTYVNWMGRSTYRGFPYTDRESPYLVMQVIDELDRQLNFNRVFVGGHSQGGYLTYLLHMHFPEKLAGTFPVAGGLVIQAEPDVFDDADLQRAQRDTPMAIVHGRRDQVVAFSMSNYSYTRFEAHDFAKTILIDPNLGHPYDFLPVGDAIEYLDMLSTNDLEALARYGEKQVEGGAWRIVGRVIDRALELDGGAPFSPIWSAREEAAKRQADRHLRNIRANRNAAWIDDYLQWQSQFAGTKAAEPVVAAFQSLRAEHDPPADDLYRQARQAFNANNANEGWAKYRQIADQYYASRRYPTIRQSLNNR